jgi:nucleotide-binding universal stress UspA family protein
MFHLRHDTFEGFMPTEEVMSEQRQQEIGDAAAKDSVEMRNIFDAWCKEPGIGDWVEVIGETAKVVAAEAANADLVIIGRAPDGYQGARQQAVHAALFDVNKATLLVPETVAASLGRSVAVAWKPSETADRAIDAALPLLLRAEHVTILMATDEGDRGANLSASFQASDRKIGQALIEEAHAVGADLLVMRAYTRSQLAEFVLGGATSEVLASADLPVLMHH